MLERWFGDKFRFTVASVLVIYPGLSTSKSFDIVVPKVIPTPILSKYKKQKKWREV